jgi:hypothetical protein
MMNFPRLAEQTLAAANTLGQWLAQNDFVSKPTPVRADAVIIPGHSVIPVIDAACAIASAQHIPLIISGGIGHSTPFLYAAVSRHSAYNLIPPRGAKRRKSLRISQRNSGRLSAKRFLSKNSRRIVAKMPGSR